MLNSNQPHPQPATGITKAQILAYAEEQALLLMNEKNQPQNAGLFVLRSADDWMDDALTEPESRMLFGEFWHEGELCILFADTNLGKSILAVQIGNSISHGKSIAPLTLQTPAQAVVYFDFELSKKQFQHRYQNTEGLRHQWSPLFVRAEIDHDNASPTGNLSFEDYLYLSLQKAVEDTQAHILIIDNITYLSNETEKAKDALPLMKHLKQMKSKYNLSILVLAHTPKRDPSRPITRNDLQGSKMLMNFCDSAFSIGESQKDRSLRYLKQIKQRNTEEIYGEDNVCLFQITKPQCFLQFDFVGYSREWEHLKERSPEDKEYLKTKVNELHEQGKSIREIAALLEISRGKVERTLKA
ncbi:AAA family ATPase [Mucilaginibacter auburnensis]|uniref:AAA domain-containing protein n=1 Tax=Mucilaginibacter auburnensis TaxID=1457233 RepID=A0A2H9VUL0_9SPHI|nr:AAA family ATPase [Mucilaginibacter auburnensis]PJJ84523.1 AAA domain-containing protein [Mucilaginibacter auburnensis]